MFCSRCGKENNDNAQFCAGCGAPLGSADTANTPTHIQYNKDNSNNNSHSNGAAVGSLVLGIIGICTGWLYGLGCILGIIGIAMSATAKKKNGGSGMATAGLVLSILAVVFGAVTLACTVCIGGVACATL